MRFEYVHGREWKAVWHCVGCRRLIVGDGKSMNVICSQCMDYLLRPSSIAPPFTVTVA